MVHFKAQTLTDLQLLTRPMCSTSVLRTANGALMVEWSSHKRPQYLPKIRSREKWHTLPWIQLMCVGERRLLNDCVCVLGWGYWGRQHGHTGREGGRETEGRAGWGLQSFPGRALSHGSFSSWDSVNSDWMVMRKVPGRAGQHRERQPRMNIVPSSRLCFGWCFERISKQRSSLVPLLLHPSCSSTFASLSPLQW